MSKKVKEYLNSIKKEKAVIKHCKEKIAKITNEYNRTIQEPEQQIANHSQNIESIENETITASLDGIITELGRIWKVNPKDLYVSLSTNIDTLFAEKDITAEDYINSHKNQGNTPDVMKLVVEHKDSKETYNKATLTNEINYDAIQADGRTLQEHFQATPRTDATAIRIDHHKDILFQYRLKDLIVNGNTQAKPYNPICKAILKAHDRYLDSIEMSN